MANAREAWPARVRGRVRPRTRLKALLFSLALKYAGGEIGLCTPLTAFRTVRKGYDLEDTAREAIAKVVGYTQLSYERLVTLYEQVAYLERRRLLGALVECGVWRGGDDGAGQSC